MVGAIDGTYIEIKGPDGEHRASYICRKGFPAIHVQVVVGYFLIFIIIFLFLLASHSTHKALGAIYKTVIKAILRQLWLSESSQFLPCQGIYRQIGVYEV